MKIIGRIESKQRQLQDRFAIYLGRVFEQVDGGENGKVVLTDNALLDINEPHMILICGKRGYGKSYTMGVLLEELLKQPIEVQRTLSVLIVDSMGVFWTLQQPNRKLTPKDQEEWRVESRGFPVTVYYPYGLKDQYEQYSSFFHRGFKLYPSELEVTDWMYLVDIEESQAQAGILVKLLTRIRKAYGGYFGMSELLNELQQVDAPENIKGALERRLTVAQAWGIFSDKGERIEDLLEPGRTTIIDLSGAGELSWNVRTTLTAILLRKLYSRRTFHRNEEELAKIFGENVELQFPLIWFFLDEGHIFAPMEKHTPATEPLLEWVRQGRRPGLSLVMATQQPGALDRRILAQCDTLIVHRLTAGNDSVAIAKKISELHDAKSISHYMRLLPKEPGYAVVLNDLTEEIVPVKIRPRQSWDGGGSAKLEEYVEYA